MSGTAKLRSEHEVILRVLQVIEALEAAMAKGTPFAGDLIAEILDFSVVFADRCHHCKEEGQLFPALEAQGMPHDSGPIACMLYEHQIGRGLIAAAKNEMDKAKGGDATSQKKVRDSLKQYVALLSQHIGKENQVLFMMADQMLSPKTQTQLEKDYQHATDLNVGCGVCQEYENKVAHLESQAVALDRGKI